MTAQQIEEAKEALDKARPANRDAWSAYLASDEAKNYSKKTVITFDDKTILVPKALAMGWQAGLVDYIVGLIEETGNSVVTLSSDDPEILVRVKERIDSSITIMPVSSLIKVQMPCLHP